MNVVLVGHFQGQRCIRWRAALLLASSLGICTSAFTIVLYFAISGGFSLIAAAIGFTSAFIVVGSGIRNALQLPFEQLTPLTAESLVTYGPPMTPIPVSRD